MLRAHFWGMGCIKNRKGTLSLFYTNLKKPTSRLFVNNYYKLTLVGFLYQNKWFFKTDFKIIVRAHMIFKNTCFL